MAIISDDNPVRTQHFVSANVVSLILSTLALPLLALFACQRWPWRGRESLTVATALCLLCYATTFLYILATSLMIHVQWERTEEFCSAMMMVCLLLRNSSKAAELAFLIERAYIISWHQRVRWRTPEYVWSSLLIIVPYIALTSIAIRFRISYMINDRICLIGIRSYAIVPMLTVEVIAQLVLTLRFLLPLIEVHRKGSGLLQPLRNVVLRTLIGCAITMLLNISVKLGLLLFNGMPVWLCFLLCKVEGFLAAAVLHWITQPVLADKQHQAERRIEDAVDDVSTDSSKELDLQEMLGLPAGNNAVNRTRA